MLGLNRKEARWPISHSMITTADNLPGFEIVDVLGIVEGVSEGSFSSVNLGGIGLSEGGGLTKLVSDARDQLAQAAADMGADAVVGFRYEVLGRNLEKSALAYGTAVRFRKEAAR